MSTRTIIEINHDDLAPAHLDLQQLVHELGGAEITGALSKGQPFYFGAIRILAQRHHTEDVTLQIGDREAIKL